MNTEIAGAAQGVEVIWCGRITYARGLELQAEAMERLVNTGQETLLLLEHEATITLGRKANTSNILAGADILAERGVTVVETDRGGDVTYHGPGQLVGYPILELKPNEQDVRAYVRRLEDGLMDYLRPYGLHMGRDADNPGVWLGMETGAPRKIAAIGVHLSRWRTRHGFALNLHTNLNDFQMIVPCGLSTKGVTSLAVECGSNVPMPQDAATVVANTILNALGRRPAASSLLGSLVGSVAAPIDVLKEVLS